MSENFCSFCQTEACFVDQHGDGGHQLICENCGALSEESPIQNPNSPGNQFELRRIGIGNWECLLENQSSSTKHAVFDSIKNSNPIYKRRLAEKRSSACSAVMTTIRNTCAKLNLDEGIQNELEEMWFAIRGSLSRVHRQRAPALGLACLYWKCKSKGMDVNIARLEIISGLKKAEILSEAMKVEKVLGNPVCSQQFRIPKQSNNSPVKKDKLLDVKDLLSILGMNLTAIHCEETKLLAEILLKLKIIPEKYSSEIVILSAFLLSEKFLNKSTKMNLKQFCSFTGLDFSRRLISMEKGFVKVLEALSGIAGFSSYAKLCFRQQLRDFVRTLDEFDAALLPKNLKEMIEYN